MDIIISPNTLSGVVDVPQSKSICHRALICAALSDKPMRLNISCPPYDVMKTIDFLRAIGTGVTVYDDHMDIVPPASLPEKAYFDCGQSGSTLRFAIPFAASLGIQAEFSGASNLSIDHISSLMELLRKHGCEFDGNSLPLCMTGRIKNGEYYIPASESSQFSSSLIMGLARTCGESRVTLIPPINSKRYVDLTVSVLSAFGSTIDLSDDGYTIHGKPFVAPSQYTPETDFALASVWLSSGVAVRGLPEKTQQADETVIDVLVSMGALVFKRDGELHCDIGNLHSFCLHAAQFPDIVPSLCAAAATAKGTSHIMGVGKLKYRDSDRVHGICELINALGGKAYAFDDDIVIEGVPTLKGGVAPCSGDHRLVYAAAIMSCKCSEPVIIQHADAVTKSYKNFWRDFSSVGGMYKEL